ncbi:polysaccharide biosynthesis tyrosine autokinase [Aetokthonos hydrillicola Thurmond2011]|jgi:capsular exopolysaccharide synthesis family protein|uniref:non-specific protein-tyrosine kinase n=1 Tax=Aetokthonos hydrillicola Thurmond2011 TaxID=2712845 RepID=A0AAP5I453_9CYAN|nr:polysaccharide biosynthesis tyrosine autokinase [Aetokthonos hydrillicola]MBO3457590.1 polysaccharide biosynthesis tyrosine autokinase [Aetokthonos hydrillicola CCALA 1050]MBW4587868.1 polysaccharide biosynthesis tyrosine autokinase [Aetokthonos hydrillicola CCALA 1050]MDR9894728.1 polysaccharide biosynthesis tyrosine autokinase [Aetokthonos hydrillicola Thurmond2011]
MLKSEKYPHPLLSQINSAQLSTDDKDELNLGQVAAVLRRRALLIVGVTGVVASAAVLKAKTDPPEYKGQFQILTKPVTGESLAVSNVPQVIGTGSKDGISPPQTDAVETTIQVLQSRGMLEPILKRLREKYQHKYPKLQLDYDSVLDDFTIESKKTKNILQVQYKNSHEDVVRDFLYLVSNAYLKYSLADRQADINQAINFVTRQINPLKQRVEYWQERQRQLRQVNNLVEPVQKAQQVSEQISTLTKQRLETRVQLEQMQAKYQDLQKEFAQQQNPTASSPILTDNERYQKILDQIFSIDAEIVKRSSIFTGEEEGVKRLSEQKAAMISMLTQERIRVNKDFQSRIHELQVRDSSLGTKIENLNASLRHIATISRDYENIERELKIATDTLNQFLAKQQALQIEKAQKQQPWKLLDPQLTKVMEPEPVRDQTKTYLALGSIVGLLLGVGAALVVDKLSNVFYTSEELKEATTLPLLGVVPFKKELGALQQQENGNNAASQAARASFFEVFRSLYTNILLLGSDTPIRSLVISSAEPGEGKTTVAIHLALSAAAMGQRVLLVDANLRAPTIHNRVGLMNIQGLTDIISQDLDWNNLIERSPLEDNLFVLTAGPIPPDPVRLLASQKMQDLMENLQSIYDLVIYDTPPLVGFADANLLSINTNGTILVAGLGQLKRTVFKQALDEIQVSGTPILGMVANKSKDPIPASYSHYQQYYKQNINVIGDDDEENSSHNMASFSSSFRSRRSNRRS